MNRALHLSALAISLAVASGLSAQAPISVPIPSQLQTAKTAFIVNAGGPINYLDQEAYIYFYQALQASKRFQLTAKPADAELSMELSLTSHIDEISNVHIPSDLLILRLNIRDVKSQSLLWSLTEPVHGGSLSGISGKDLATSATDLVTDFNTLISGPLVAPPVRPGPKVTRLSQEP
jgi:hypothetical protein